MLTRPYWNKDYTTEAALAMTNWLLKQSDICHVFATCDIENSVLAHVIDESGEGYLFEASRFISIELPAEVERALVAA